MEKDRWRINKELKEIVRINNRIIIFKFLGGTNFLFKEDDDEHFIKYLYTLLNKNINIIMLIEEKNGIRIDHRLIFKNLEINYSCDLYVEKLEDYNTFLQQVTEDEITKTILRNI